MSVCGRRGATSFTHLDAQAQQVVHRAAHATGGSGVQRRVSLLVLAVHLGAAGHQQLHHLQVTWGMTRGCELAFGGSRVNGEREIVCLN